MAYKKQNLQLTQEYRQNRPRRKDPQKLNRTNETEETQVVQGGGDNEAQVEAVRPFQGRQIWEI